MRIFSCQVTRSVRTHVVSTRVSVQLWPTVPSAFIHSQSVSARRMVFRGKRSSNVLWCPDSGRGQVEFAAAFFGCAPRRLFYLAIELCDSRVRKMTGDVRVNNLSDNMSSSVIRLSSPAAGSRRAGS